MENEIKLKRRLMPCCEQVLEKFAKRIKDEMERAYGEEPAYFNFFEMVDKLVKEMSK